MARWTKAFFNFLWKNWPSVDSPVNASNLNKQNNAIEEIDSRVLFLDDVKLDASKADVMVKDVLLDEDTGILKVIHYNGDTDTYSSLLSKIAINFDFDRETQKIILYLRDGTPKEIDLSEFIMEYEFVKSDTISFSVSKRKDIFDLEVPAGGIGYNSAQRFPMKEEAGKTITAEAEMDLAEISGTWKKRGSSETLTINFFPDELLPNRVFTAFLDGTWETISISATATADAGGKVFVYFSKGGEVSAEVRKGSITEEHLRPDYLADIRLEASKAEASKNAAAEKADDSARSALLSKSYSDGTSGVRDGEATDNAKYYKEQAKAYYDSLTQSGNVTGVKGSAESTYRTGNVELTAANIGAVPAAGGNFTGNVVFDKYMTLRAWEGYGSGSANFWYNGNTKTIDFKGDVKNIDLNASSSDSLKYFKNTSSTPVGLDDTDSNAIGYVNGSVPISNAGSDGALYRQAYNGSYAHEVFGDYRTGQIAVRGKNNGTWQSWRRILDSTNFKDYVTKYAIELGNVDNTADANKNVASAKLLGLQSENWRQGNDLPSTYPIGETIFISSNPVNRFNNIQYCTIQTIRHFYSTVCFQFLYPYNTNADRFYFRTSVYDTDAWRPWYEVITTKNIGSQSVNYASSAGSASTATKATQDGSGNNIVSTYLPKSGGTMSGSIITPQNDSMGIIPAANNYGQIGSSDKKFYRMYASTFYGNLDGSATKATQDGNGNNIASTYLPKKTNAYSVTGTNALNFNSTAFNNSSELYIYLLGPQSNSMRSCYSWTVDTETLKSMGTLRLIDGYKINSFEGSAEVEISTTHAKLIRMNVSGTNFDNTATLRVVFR